MTEEQRQPGRRVTYTDVARRAGVGTATVDRVLHERGNVSEAVRLKVIEAARDLGLPRILPSAYRRTVRVNVILSRIERPLLARMAAEVARLAQRSDKALRVHRTHLPDETPENVARAMLAQGYDAVIVAAPDHPRIHAAIAALKQRGIPVVTLISDVPGAGHLAHAGTDHAKAGRSAAYFMARMTAPRAEPQKVLILCHTEGFHAHALRIAAFAEQLALEAPHLSIAATLRHNDDSAVAEPLLRAAFREHPETVGLYNAGGANRGVAAAMRADLLPARPLFIGHELTNFTWHILREGLMTLTIDQNPELQAQRALQAVMRHFGFEEAGEDAPEVPFVLYGPQNLPDAQPA